MIVCFRARGAAFRAALHHQSSLLGDIDETHTHTTQQRVDDFYSSFIFVGGSFISSSSSSSSSSLKQCLFVSVALFNKRAYSKLKMICNNYNQFFFCVCIYVKLIILLSLFSLLQMK
jgi:hypothetical protein